MAFLERIQDLSPGSLARFDAIVDVRSPAEFADDHLPGAISLPVLSNVERAEVGTVYKQQSPFLANRIGAALVARNIAGHLDGCLASRPKSWRPLIYCWRGGMRSNAMATILSSVGWPVGVVDGGYRRWRRETSSELEADGPVWPVVLIDGETGSGKTALLAHLAQRGAQVIDLEGLAAHRGSAFGGFADLSQPPQRLFESQLWTALRQFDGAQPIYVEAEMARVGARRLPRRLWFSMRAAPRIEIAAPVAARATALIASYGDAVSDLALVEGALARLKSQHADETLKLWRDLAAAGDHQAFAETLIREHYDAHYRRARKRLTSEAVLHIALARVDASELARAADLILSDTARFRASDSTPSRAHPIAQR